MKVRALSFLLGCIMTSAAVAEMYHVYIGNGGTDGIAKVVLDTETGAFTHLRIVTPAHTPNFMVFSKDKPYCYSTNRSKDVDGKPRLGGVSAYLRTADGTLELLQSRLTGGSGACHVSLDRSGKVLLVANYGSGSLASFKVKLDGSLSPAVSVPQHKGSSVHPKRQQRPHAHSIYASPDNKHVYAADLGTDAIEVYDLDVETAEIKSIGSFKVPAGGGPRHMCFSHDGSIIYVLNELSTSITIMDRDVETGSLEVRKTVSLLGEGEGEDMTSSEIRMSDDGRFMYAANRDLANKGRDSISVLVVDGEGGLKVIQTAAAGVWIPRHFDITPCGKNLLVAGQRSNFVVSHKRDTEAGTLSATGKRVAVKAPMWIGFVPKY
ncbi:lactonase family protein [Rubritalea tangerina]|uniref:Lactonase family protein n=1 Tax=Rubritalea tangerina TaxID=430798 RepID=A0ABW4ZDL7_9BACT